MEDKGAKVESQDMEVAEKKEPRLEFSGATVASLRHPDRNEDAIGYGDDWAAVLDGVRGSFAGEAASRKALEVISKNLSNFSPSGIEGARAEVKQTIISASDAVYGEGYGGESTVVVAKLVNMGGSYFAVIGSVGDSRAYLFRDGSLIQITDDDSVILKEVAKKLDDAEDDNNIDDREYNYFMRRNIITQDLGGGVVPEVHLYTQELKQNDILLLSTDGVHDNLTRRAIEQIVQSRANIVHDLIQKAKERSMDEGHFRAKKDDISAVVIKVK